MFQTMSESVNIPHFLYTQVINLTELTSLRKRVADGATQYEKGSKLSALPFVVKALSETIKQFPIVNSSIDTKSGLKHPAIIQKAAHNIGIAMDTPKGLVVPVVRNVQEHTVFSLNKELQRLRDLAAVGKLSPSDMADATIVVSNIGSIGGHVVAPVILPPTVMILGMGRSREVPAFQKDEDGKDKIVKREEVVLSWSADHRVLDGATVAKAAQEVGSYIENMTAKDGIPEE
jgi:2-oxoisovalerate dehydrogenase E2 component (dihydrolipoyl transacylase)